MITGVTEKLAARALNDIIENIQKLTNATYMFTVSSEYVAENAKPGQFVNIKCCDGIETILRRPVSICRVDRIRKTFDIAFQVRGKGTGILAEKSCAGSRLDYIGPLGKPFDILGCYSKIAVVGGGIGIFPLLFLLEETGKLGGDIVKDAFLGFKDIGATVLKEEFEAVTNRLIIATDDGSCGSKGFITDICEESADISGYDIIYTCGPEPMMRKVAATASKYGVKCQVSLEQRMGCGIGACLVCACKTAEKDGSWKYSHVCKDGPVFWSSEIVW